MRPFLGGKHVSILNKRFKKNAFTCDWSVPVDIKEIQQIINKFNEIDISFIPSIKLDRDVGPLAELDVQDGGPPPILLNIPGLKSTVGRFGHYNFAS